MPNITLTLSDADYRALQHRFGIDVQAALQREACAMAAEQRALEANLDAADRLADAYGVDRDCSDTDGA